MPSFFQRLKGRDSEGHFLPGSRAAVEAGSKGGRAAHERGTAHQLTAEQRRLGGVNSHASREATR